MFGKHWTPAQGIVIDRHSAMTTGDGMVTIYEFIVDVRTAEGETFRAKVGEPRIATNFLAPSIGDTVAVEYDSGRTVRFDKDDQALSAKAAKRRREAEFNDILTRSPGTALAAGRSVDPQVVQLQALFQVPGTQPPPNDSTRPNR